VAVGDGKHLAIQGFECRKTFGEFVEIGGGAGARQAGKRVVHAEQELPFFEIREQRRHVVGAPLQFDAPFYGLLISSADLASRLTTAVPELADVHDRVAWEAMRKLEQAEISRRAREAVVRCLPDGAPARSTIAAALSMSDHTFQRRLTSEGTSFSKLVDETRRELVQRHLADRRLSSSEIAYLVGYSDQSTFFRATHRWFGESPGEYRARLAAGHEREIAEVRRK